MKKELLLKLLLLMLMSGLALVAVAMHLSDAVTYILLYSIGVVSVFFIKISNLLNRLKVP